MTGNKTVRFTVSEDQYNKVKQLSYIKGTSISDFVRTEISQILSLHSEFLDSIEDQRLTISFNTEEFELLDSERPERKERSLYLLELLQKGLTLYQDEKFHLDIMEEFKGPGTESSIKLRIPGNLFVRVQNAKPPFVSITKWIAVLILTGL